MGLSITASIPQSPAGPRLAGVFKTSPRGLEGTSASRQSAALLWLYCPTRARRDILMAPKGLIGYNGHIGHGENAGRFTERSVQATGLRREAARVARRDANARRRGGRAGHQPQSARGCDPRRRCPRESPEQSKQADSRIESDLAFLRRRFDERLAALRSRMPGGVSVR